jgi:hypothetical protein
MTEEAVFERYENTTVEKLPTSLKALNLELTQVRTY